MNSVLWAALLPLAFAPEPTKQPHPKDAMQVRRFAEAKSIPVLRAAYSGNNPTILTHLSPLPPAIQRDFEPGPYTFAFSPAENKIAYRSAVRVTLWNLDTGKELQTLRNPAIVMTKDTPDGRPGLVFSPDGATLAVGGYDGNVHLFKTCDVDLIRTLKGPKVPPVTVFFSSDGSQVSALYRKAEGNDICLTLITWPTGKGERRTIELGKRQSPLWAVCGSGRKMAVGSANGPGSSEIHLWNLTSGAKTTLKLGFHNPRFQFDPTGILTVASHGRGNATVELFVVSEKGATEKTAKFAFQHKINNFLFSPDGQFLLIHGGNEPSDTGWRLIEMRTKKERWSSEGYESAQFSPGGTLMARVGAGLTLVATKELQSPLWAEESDRIHKARLIDKVRVNLYNGAVRVELIDSRVDQATVKKLVETLPIITHVQFSFARSVSPKMLEPLKTLSKLEGLSLPYGVKMNDDALAVVGELNTLKSLNLQNCNSITGAGLAHLRGLTALGQLTLPSESKIAAKDIEMLQSALPKCKITKQK